MQARKGVACKRGKELSASEERSCTFSAPRLPFGLVWDVSNLTGNGITPAETERFPDDPHVIGPIGIQERFAELDFVHIRIAEPLSSKPQQKRAPQIHQSILRYHPCGDLFP